MSRKTSEISASSEYAGDVRSEASSVEAARRMVALLGQPDTPTDGVADYCFWLDRALATSGWALESVRVPWPQGWWAALRWLWRESRNWRGQWVLVQYTAFAWSRRGFPLGLIAVLWILRRRGTKIAAVLHDPRPCLGGRLIDRLRRGTQLRVLRTAYRWADRSIFTIPLDRTSWLPQSREKAAFVPVGANFAGTRAALFPDRQGSQPRTIAVFGVTGGVHTQPEVDAIAHAMCYAAAASGAPLRLLVLGRHEENAAVALRAAFAGTAIETEIYGVLPADVVERELSEADVFLFVRGGISSQRGSAIAGIVCGLPVVAYAGSETAPPVTEAGVVLVPQGDLGALAAALTRVMTDDALRAELRRRSVEARERYFSWHAIAEKYAHVLNLER